MEANIILTLSRTSTRTKIMRGVFIDYLKRVGRFDAHAPMPCIEQSPSISALPFMISPLECPHSSRHSHIHGGETLPVHEIFLESYRCNAVPG